MTSGAKFSLKVALPLLVLTLAVGGCSGKETPTKAKSSSPTATSGVTASPNSAAATAKASGSRQTAAPAPAGGGSGLLPGSVQPTAPGKYSYNELGASSFNCGRPRTQQAPSPTTLKVDAAAGSRQRQVRDRRGSDGQGVLVTTDFEFRPDGIHLAYLHQQQFTPIGDDTFEFQPNPIVLFVPKDPQAGQSWQFSLKSTDGQVNVDAANAVEVAEEPVTLADGSSVSSVRIRTTRHWTGRFNRGRVNIDEDEQWWMSLSDRFVVKGVDDSSGFVSGCVTNSHFEELLGSAAAVS